MRALAQLLCATLCLCVRARWHHLDPAKLQTRTPPNIQADTATRLIRSTYYTPLPTEVVVQVDPALFRDSRDSFSLLSADGVRLTIRASSGVAAVWGFNYYLKKYLNTQIDWQDSNIEIGPLVKVNETVVANDRFRYYQNVCTASYSFVWWRKEEWRRHVTWMALSGVNLALAPVAAEAAWAAVYRELGLSDDEIDDHFTGPAFLAWQRMGNVRHWAGPLRPSWHNAQLDTQAEVVPLMYDLGMVPVLPAFNGHVPRAFARVFPNSTLLRVDTWNRFGADDCCGLFLSPTDPLFQRVGRMFLRQVAQSANYSHVFAADPFNEVAVLPWSTALVRDTAAAIVATITAEDPDAVWMLQNWMFVHDPLLWPEARVRALLGAAPPGRALVLDLQAEQWPQYSRYDMYYGQPFIWCMLHNFGGTLGMFGSLSVINEEVHAARALPNSTMVGIGLTPEGINQNYVVYELMLETAWRRGPEPLDEWVQDYAMRRYGCNATARAWRHLAAGVYAFDGLNRIRGKYVMTRRPSFALEPWAWYNSSSLFAAWQGFVDATEYGDCNSPHFLHDLVDVTRQALQYRAEQLYLAVRRARRSGPYALNATGAQFLEVLDDMQRVLSCYETFTAAEWLSNARRFGLNDVEKDQYEMNARNQITLWGPNGEISDYAAKQWAELFEYYYTPRWRVFLAAAESAAARGEPFDERGAQDIIRQGVERAFMSVSIEPARCAGRPYDVVRQLHSKWALLPGAQDLPLAVIPRAGPADPAGPEPSVVMVSTDRSSTLWN